MKRTVAFVALAFGGTFLPGLVSNALAQDKCSVATLQGEYLVTGGTEASLDQRELDSFPVRIVAVWNFDGEGRLTGFTIQNVGGLINRIDNLSGTYTMDSDRCVATLTFAGTDWDVIIMRDGSEGAAIRVDADVQGRTHIATRFLKKRS